MDQLERNVAETLRAAANSAPGPSTAPAGGRPREARSRHPRSAAHRTITLAAAALAAACIVTAVVLVSDDNQPNPNPPASTAPPAADLNELVGVGGAVLPIPDGWSVNDYRCGNPQSNTIGISLPAAFPACIAEQPPDVREIQLHDLDSTAAARWRKFAAEDITLEDGTPARYGSTNTPSDLRPGHHAAVLVVPEWEAIAVGLSPRKGQLDTVLRQLGPTPPDAVALPLLVGMTAADGRAALVALGLDVVDQRLEHPDTGRVVDSEPGLGRLVRVGDTVFLEIAQ